MTGLKKITYNFTNLKGGTIELEHNKTKITKEYNGKRQPELKQIAEQLNLPIRKNIKKAVIYIEVEYEM